MRILLLFFILFMFFEAGCEKCSNKEKEEEEIFKKIDEDIKIIDEDIQMEEKKIEKDEIKIEEEKIIKKYEILTWEEKEYPQPGTSCEIEGQKRCIAPGNYTQGRKEYVVCEKNKKGELLWVSYECSVEEILNDCVKEGEVSEFMWTYYVKQFCAEENKEKAKETIKAVCQENKYGVVCCPKIPPITDYSYYLCDKEGYRRCADHPGFDSLQVCTIESKWGINFPEKCFKRKCLVFKPYPSLVPCYTDPYKEPSDLPKGECIDTGDGHACCTAYYPETGKNKCYPPECEQILPKSDCE